METFNLLVTQHETDPDMSCDINGMTNNIWLHRETIRSPVKTVLIIHITTQSNVYKYYFYHTMLADAFI